MYKELELHDYSRMLNGMAQPQFTAGAPSSAGGRAMCRVPCVL